MKIASWIYRLALHLCILNPVYALDNRNEKFQKDFENKNYFMLELKDNSFIESITKIHPTWNYEYQIDTLDTFHVFSLPKNDSDIDWLTQIDSVDDIIDNREHHLLLKREQQDFVDLLHENKVHGVHPFRKRKLEKRIPIPIDHETINLDKVFHKRAKLDSVMEELANVEKEFDINDPIFKDQWHIFNTAFPGHDVNVIPVWRMNITGKGVVTALIDDGLDYDSPDLKDNYSPEGSWDYNDNRPNPKPELVNDWHGTRCAGEIAAAKSNGYCGVGVAYDSKVAGIRILSGEISPEDEANAMMYGLDVNDIYSCSWGPPDNGKSMDVPDKIVRAAMMKGILDGRDGKGALYVFASGNGARHQDSCNFDGYTNSIYSLTVSAIDHKGLHPDYAESCNAVMVVTYSSGSGEHIHTTDINDQCADGHGGTSAAAPLAAGIYALILEANPELTWRDVQYLTVLSAAEIDPSDGSWHDTAIEGRKYSKKYGWGKIDAEKMVKMAQDDWKLLKPQAWYYMPYQIANKGISNEIGEVEDSFTVTSEHLQNVNFDHVEQITVTVDITANKRGAVEVDLISPSGIVSALAVSRPRDIDQLGFRKWTFSSVAHWGESGAGEWTIKVRNTDKTNSVKLIGWQLRAFGECVNPDLATRFDMNEDYSKLNLIEANSTSGSLVLESTSTNLPSKSESSSHVTTSVESSSETTSVQFSSTVEESVPTSTSTDDTNKEIESATAPTTTHSTLTSASASASSSSVPEEGTYPHTDESRHYITYFSAFLISGFLILLYMLKNRRAPGRARRREDFEFDIIHPDEDESRFEFDDSDFSDNVDNVDNDSDTHNNNSNNNGKKNHILDDEFDIFDDDANPISFSEDSKDMRIIDSAEDSGFDLGSSKLAGYSKTDDIIKDAQLKESDESRLFDSSKQKQPHLDPDYSTEHSNLISSTSTSDDDHLTP